MVSVNVKRFVIALVVSLLLLSASPTLASADHDKGIFEWVDDTAEDDDYYGIEDDPYLYFSGDDERIDQDDVYNSTNDAFEENMENDAAAETFYEVGDYAFEEPQDAVLKWNRQNLQEFSTGGHSTSVYPIDEVPKSQLKDGSNNRIKDAYVSFYSIDPSTTVHTKPNSDDRTKAVTEYRVGDTIDINLVHSARGNEPTSGLLDRAAGAIVKEKKLVSVEEFGVESTRIYSSDCGDGQECVIAERNNPGEEVRFENVPLPSDRAQTLRVESEYSARYKIELENSDWECKGDWISIDDYIPSSDVECEWTDFEVVDVSYTSDDVVVEDEIDVIVDAPDATAVQANLPGDYESYYIENLERAEWSKITFGEDGEETVGARSAWRFFGSRDQRWDTYCEKDGSSSGGVLGNPCGGRLDDPMHYEDSGARPLLTHAIPSPYGVQTETNNNFHVATPESRWEQYPTAQKHKTCENGCDWTFVMYQSLNPASRLYQDPESIVIQRSSEADYVRAHGLVEGSSSDVEITDTRDVHLAKIDYERLYSGEDVPDTVREQTDRDFPDENEVRVSLHLYDNNTGESIDLTERDREYVKITDGTRVYQAIPGADGTVTVDLIESEGTYRFTYEHEDWWDTPADQQAYTTEGALRHNPSETYTINSAMETLSKFAVILLIPLVLFLYILRAAGIDVSIWDMWRIIKRDWLP